LLFRSLVSGPLHVSLVVAADLLDADVVLGLDVALRGGVGPRQRHHAGYVLEVLRALHLNLGREREGDGEGGRKGEEEGGREGERDAGSLRLITKNSRYRPAVQLVLGSHRNSSQLASDGLMRGWREHGGRRAARVLPGVVRALRCDWIRSGSFLFVLVAL